MRQIKPVLAIAIGMALFEPLAQPQGSTTIVRGNVRDQTDSAIVGASLSLINSATGITVKTTTNDTGFYIFPGVLPSTYRLTAEAPGFQLFEANVTVQVQQVAVVNPVLVVGATSTKVEVIDVTPILNVDNPTLGHVLERRRIEQLPINGRNLTTLLQTVPGMEGTRAYGLRQGSHEFVLDGAAISERVYGEVQRRPPGLDTILEFKVENNGSSAKFTRPTSVIISTRSGTNQLHGSLFETHRNNALGKARQRQDFYSKPPQLIRNEYGGSMGGPVMLPKVYDGRNKTFWFFAYEGLRSVSPFTLGFQVPTEAMRRGDFRGLVDAQGRQYNIYDPYTTDSQTWSRQPVSYNGQLNVADPARISPLAKYLFSVTPLPTQPNVNPLLDNNWFGPVPRTARQWTTTTRIDHRISDKDQFYARYTQGDSFAFEQKFTQPMLNNAPGTVFRLSPNKSFGASWVRNFSPTLFNEFLVSGNRETYFLGTGEKGRKYADELGLPNPLNASGWPGLYDTGLSSYYFETDNTQGYGVFYGILDNHTTKIKGKHELQFGFHYRYDQLNVLPDQQQNQGNHSWASAATSLYDTSTSRTNPLAAPFSGHNLANMYFGVMNYSNQFIRSYFYMRAKEYALYFQDNYKITPRLTLNLGLRWEYWPAFREKNNVLSTFDPQRRAVVLGTDLDTMYRLGATAPSIVNRLQSLGAKFINYQEAGLSQSLMASTKRDIGPRIGFAYRAGDGAKSFVVRGGYRISYFPIPLRPWSARMRSNAPLTARFRVSLTDASLTPDGIGNYGMRSVPTVIAGQNSRNVVTLENANALTRGSVLASYFAASQPDPRVHDWNLTFEKEVMPDTVARVSYIGNHGGFLEQFNRYNEPTPDYIWFQSTKQQLPTGEFSNVLRRPYDQTVYGTVEEYRKTGWSNFNGMQFELERRYAKGFAYQIFYVVGNALGAGGQDFSGTSIISATNQFMPGLVPDDIDQRNRLLNYQRDTGLPKHRLRWNWIADLPFGKGKPIGRNAGAFLDRVIGGWQVAGLGTIRSNYFTLPTGTYPTGTPVEQYGYKYPIEDCRSGACRPGFLFWNGYIPANRINSVDAQGRPNGVMGVPANYKPSTAPLIPAGSTAMPANAPAGTVVSQFWDTNTVWVPLNNGTVQRTVFNDGLHPWRQQYLPGVRQWGVDASLFKTIPITESVRLRLNADFFNVFNNPGNPNSIGGDGILSTMNSGNAARELQLTLRLTW
ncbi:MAG: TonB-dependent receptor [Acidobacteria bacterium]|nr:TonB-dependent receptor [Acidobacteriota bacterium]